MPADCAHLHVEIPDWSLNDASVRWILTLLEPQGPALAPNSLLLDTAAIMRLGTPCTGRGGEPAHRVSSPLPAPTGGLWAAFACPTDALADRLLPPLASATQEVIDDIERPQAKTAVHWMGALAEVEVMRLLSGVPELNVFKSFPDIELCEYVVRRAGDGLMRGIQVKCVGLDGPEDSGAFFVPARDLEWPTTALIVVLAWRHDLRAFDPHALLFAASRMTELGHRSEARWVGVFCPNPKRSSRFAQVMVRCEEVGARVLAAP
jgi:hypothetical protein